MVRDSAMVMMKSHIGNHDRFFEWFYGIPFSQNGISNAPEGASSRRVLSLGENDRRYRQDLPNHFTTRQLCAVPDGIMS